MAHKLNITVEFLEPYRVQEWLPKEDRYNDKFRREAGFVRIHKNKQKEYTLYLPGTLLRSALLSAAEDLLNLNKGIINNWKCCPAVFLPDKGKSKFKRLKPVNIKNFKKDFCQFFDQACPLCLLSGRKKLKSDYNNYNVHFSNFNLINRRYSKNIEDLTIKRAINRIDTFTGKAHDYFEIYEVVDKNLWKFYGEITIAEEIYEKVYPLIANSLAFIETMAGSICEVVIENESMSNNKNFESKDLNSEIQKFIDDILKSTSKDKRLCRKLADMFRKLAQKNIFELPDTPNKDHPIWDKIKIKNKTLREIISIVYDKYPEQYILFCKICWDRFYKSSKEPPIQSLQLPTATPEYLSKPATTSFAPARLRELPVNKYLFVISGTLRALTPFYFGLNDDEGRVLFTKEGKFRIPRSALRGILRKNLSATGLNSCNVKVGKDMLCPCDVCKIMRNIKILDAESEQSFNFIPENRKRIRINPYSGTVAEGALFEEEFGPENTTFPFIMRIRTNKDKLPDSMKNIIYWWQNGYAFLSGSTGIGRGRFVLENIKIHKFDLSDEQVQKAYIKESGFKGKEHVLSNNLIPFEEKSDKLKKFFYDKIDYEVILSSPTIVKDTLYPLTENVTDNPDAVFYRCKYFKNNKLEEKIVFPSESFRGILRSVLGKEIDKLSSSHEACECELCKIFGNVHSQGSIIVEDLSIKSDLGEGIIDHVAIDRFLMKSREHYKYNFKPILASPLNPAILKGTIFIKKELSNKEKQSILKAFSIINSGLIALGGNASTGYGEVRGLRILNAPDWLKKDFPITVNLTSIEDIDKAQKIALNYLDKKGSYFPYVFIAPLNSVKRSKTPPTHDKYHKELLSGKIEVEMNLLTPLIIPDTNKGKDEKGHYTYPFFRVGQTPAIAGSTLKGCFSSLYETITNSCYRVFDEEYYLSWRMDGKDAAVSNPEKGKNKFIPGMVVGQKNGELKIKPMMSMRIPVYDNPELENKIRENIDKIYYNHPTPYEKIVFKCAENNREMLKQNIENRKWKKIITDNPNDPIVVSMDCNNGYYNCECIEDGYIKLTGPNVIQKTNLNNKEKNKKLYNQYEHSNWYECVHNKIGYKRPVMVYSKKQRKLVKRLRNIPFFSLIKDPSQYKMTKRCERVFVPIKSKEITIPEDAIKRYEIVLEKYKENWDRNDTPEIFRTILPGDGKTLQDGDLIYFQEENGKVKNIIPVSISRIVDELPLINRLDKEKKELWPCVLTTCPNEDECKDCLLKSFSEGLLFKTHKEGLCPACFLFGTSIYKSRVRFSFAWAENYKFFDKKITLPRLEKPRAEWMIRKQSEDEVIGRKFYLHSDSWESWINNSEKESKTENNATFEIMEQGKFKFNVYFENLHNWELGLLLMTLSALGGAVKLGHAKALGFGSVKTKINNIFLKDKNTSFEYNELLQKGENKLKEWFGEKAEGHISNIKNILCNKVKKTKYPDIKEYKKLKEKIIDNKSELLNPLDLKIIDKSAN